MIERNCPNDWEPRGYPAMALRTGANLRDLSADVLMLEEGADFSFVDCPDGIVFKRIAYLAPVNQPESWLLNIAKFKAHGMGITLCCKNQQGMCANTYVNFCANLGGINSYPSHVRQDFQPDREERVTELYAHLLPGHLDRGRNAVSLLPETMAATMADGSGRARKRRNAR